MKHTPETNELEKYLEKNASKLVESKEDKHKYIRAAQNDIRARQQRAQRLQSLRRNKLKLSQSALARAVGANVRTLQSWERGRQEYPKSVEILMKLMDDIPTVRKKLLNK